jgi:BppU N-terminal domain
MALNRTHRAKRGETGKIITVTFYDENGDKLNLTGYTAVFEVTAAASAANVLEGTSMTISNQTTNLGEATYTLTANDALIAAGEYQWEARATHTASGRVYIVPNIEGDEFGKFIMRASKI